MPDFSKNLSDPESLSRVDRSLQRSSGAPLNFSEGTPLTDERQSEIARIKNLSASKFSTFQSLGKSFEFSPDGLASALKEKAHANDLTRSVKLIKELGKAIPKGLKGGDVSVLATRGFAQVFRDFADSIDSNSRKSAAKMKRVISALANMLDNKAEASPYNQEIELEKPSYLNSGIVDKIFSKKLLPESSGSKID